MLNLWLIRHGQTNANLGHWEAHPQNTELTALGRTQAQAAAQQVSSCPDLIISSPLKRARDSADYIVARWPDAPFAIWPIQEFVYLSPQAMSRLDPDARKARIAAYWEEALPDYCDGEDAESFSGFMQRVREFDAQVQALQGFAVVVGHGQFFKAWLFARQHGLDCSGAWMRAFRQEELAHPLGNSDVYKLKLT